jgi:4-deoxy-L-threo-5-hexosulose-uronate ketol-isomerase
MGLTQLKPGSVWNIMSSHTHDRRMEAYLYFNLPEGQRVLHMLGEPTETRPLWMSNEHVILSPPWSIHTGCGTAAYAFIWGMAGENRDTLTWTPCPSGYCASVVARGVARVRIMLGLSSGYSTV